MKILEQIGTGMNFAANGEMRMYRYFENVGSKTYDAANIEELSPEMLSCICAFQYTTLGAEGGGGRILMIDEIGNFYAVYHSYLSETNKNEYETHAYEYIDKYLDIQGKTAVPRREWHTEKDGWTTITNWLGWYIACRNDVWDRIPTMSNRNDIEYVMFNFPDYFNMHENDIFIDKW